MIWASTVIYFTHLATDSTTKKYYIKISLLQFKYLSVLNIFPASSLNDCVIPVFKAFTTMPRIKIWWVVEINPHYFTFFFVFAYN